MEILPNSERKYLKLSQNESDMPIGKVRIPFEKKIKILAIADTHNCLEYDDLKLYSNYDICLLLGDLSDRDIKRIKECVSTPIFGIVGHHDGFNDLLHAGIEDIHGKVINFKDVTIAGWRGSLKYKDADYPFFTDEESSVFAKSLPRADILISHDGPKYFHSKDFAHSGLIGITEYLKSNKVALNLHGHHHDKVSKIMDNGTLSMCVYRCQFIDTSSL